MQKLGFLMVLINATVVGLTLHWVPQVTLIDRQLYAVLIIFVLSALSEVANAFDLRNKLNMVGGLSGDIRKNLRTIIINFSFDIILFIFVSLKFPGEHELYLISALILCTVQLILYFFVQRKAIQ
jgi:hypothetical protein